MHFVAKRTLISQQTASSWSSLVMMPAPDARLTPTRAKKGRESPKSSWRVTFRRRSAATVCVTLLRTASTMTLRACCVTCWTSEGRATAPDDGGGGAPPSPTRPAVEYELILALWICRTSCRPFLNSRKAARRIDISTHCTISSLFSTFGHFSSLHHVKSQVNAGKHKKKDRRGRGT